MNNLTGQSILILGGNTKEIIDGMRHYANQARPENHGLEAAKLLVAEGTKVTLITPALHETAPKNVEVITTKPNGQPIISARDMVETVEDYAKRADIKAVLHLANISSIRPAQISEQKLKVKKEAGHTIPMEVVGNIDAWEHLEAAFPDIPIVGYQNQKITANVSNSLVESLMTMVEKAWLHANKPFVLPPTNATQPTNELAERKIIITSGPTVEKLTVQGDVITNFSSGKQGQAVAEALADMGAKVALVAGSTAGEMLEKVMAQLPADAFIGVAAVADFGLEHPLDLHLKEGKPYTLQLAQNPDILQTVGTHKTLRPKVVIGFAAETEKLLEYARGKLEKKGADAICANQSAAAGKDRNQISWVTKDGAEPWEIMNKRAIGQKIGAKLADMLDD